MEKEKAQEQSTQSESGNKTNPVSNSSPVQDNSSPDNDQQSGSPKGEEKSDQQNPRITSDR